MKNVSEVIKAHGGPSKLAKKINALGNQQITRNAISLWGKYIPDMRCYQIADLPDAIYEFEDLPSKSKITNMAKAAA